MFGVCILGFIGLLWIIGCLYTLTEGRIGKRIFHDMFDWHMPDKDTFDDEEVKCKFCGKEIEQDEQGNWYLR